MDFEEFRGRIEEAEKRSAAGDERTALAVLKALAESDLPDLDRALVWVQAASACDRENANVPVRPAHAAHAIRSKRKTEDRRIELDTMMRAS